MAERERRQCLITVELETGEGAQALTCGFECRGQEAPAAANAICQQLIDQTPSGHDFPIYDFGDA